MQNVLYTKKRKSSEFTSIKEYFEVKANLFKTK